MSRVRSTGPELYPFCGDVEVAGDGTAGRGIDWTCPGEWPLDCQCILRLPEDLAQRAADCLTQQAGGKEAAGNTSEALDVELRPDHQAAAGDAVPGRRWRVKAWGEELQGTLVDLPCHVESHLLPGDSDAPEVAYKLADVQQMLIVHRGPEPPEASRCLDRSTFKWKSGLTPPAQFISARKFRGVPPSDSMFSRANVAEAVRALRDRLAGAAFVYEEEAEVDEKFFEQIRKEQPENIWRPPAGGGRKPQPQLSRQATPSAAGSEGQLAGASSVLKRRSEVALSTASSGRVLRSDVAMSTASSGDVTSKRRLKISGVK